MCYFVDTDSSIHFSCAVRKPEKSDDVCKVLHHTARSAEGSILVCSQLQRMAQKSHPAVLKVHRQVEGWDIIYSQKLCASSPFIYIYT